MKIATFTTHHQEVEKNKKWPQILVTLSAITICIGCGLHFGWLSPAQPKLLSGDMPFKVKKEDISYMGIIQPLGYFIGCPFSGFLVNTIGRKPSILLLVIPQISAWLLIGTAQEITFVFVARFVAGVGEGAIFTLLPIYLGEISEPSIRGCLLSCFQGGIIFGLVLINAYGSYMHLKDSVWVSILVPVLFFVTFIWMPESPYYSLMKGDVDKARTALKFLRGRRNVEEELTQLKTDVQRQISEPGRLKDVFSIDTNRKAFFILLGLRAFQQFSGLSSINMYAQTIFHEVGSQVNPAISSTIFMIIQLFAVIATSLLVDKFGRKTLFIASGFGSVVCLIAEVSYFYLQKQGMDMSSVSWMALIGLYAYILVFTVGFGVIPNLMTGELLSASVKGKALGVMNLGFAVFISTNAKIFQVLEIAFGMYASFLFFAVCCLIGIIFGFKCVPETKGITLEEIQQKLRNKPKVLIKT